MYILFINPTKSPQALAPVFPAHSEFLERYCKAGKFILTGGLTARPAGMVLANVNSGDELKAMLEEDPFVREQVAEYEVIEFKPSRYHESLASLIALSAENS
jgi:uncharacterized protein YciI